MGIARLHWAAGACLAAALWLSLGPASAQQSQNWNQNWKWCENKNNAYPPDLQISGCTAVIQSGRENRKNLVVAFYNRGNAYSRKGDYDRAVDDYSEAIRLDPKNAAAFNNRCLADNNKGDPQRAIADCNEAIRLDPKFAGAFYNRGIAYDNKGDFDRAIADYNEVIRLFPQATAAFINRGVVYNYKGDPDRAIADFNEAIRLGPKAAPAFNNRGTAYRAKGDLDRAIADHNEALQLLPTYAHAFYDRGITHYDKGDYDRAVADYSETIRLQPKAVEAFERRGEAYETKGDLAKAKADFEKAVSLPSKNYWFIKQAQEQARTHLAELATKATPEEVIPDPGVRVALIIGNSKYEYEDVGFLPNPQRDAEAVADTFRRLGFQTVIARFNLTLREFRTALDTFEDKVKQGADWAVIYYAGHGAEVAGVKYLFPVDANRPKTERDLRYEAVPVDDLRAAAGMARKLRVIILDACRDNPFLRRMKVAASRSVSRGFSRIYPEADELVAFSAGENQIAGDGIGEHSPFTQAFLNNVVKPRVEIGMLFRRVYDEVTAATGKKQQPATYSSLPGDLFYFAIK